VELDNGETLYLVTTRGISAEQAAEFYSRRVVHISELPSEQATVFRVRMADTLRRRSSYRVERRTASNEAPNARLTHEAKNHKIHEIRKPKNQSRRQSPRDEGRKTRPWHSSLGE